MSEKPQWRYCVVGNIVKTHVDENGILRYGTPAFKGGARVYLVRNFWEYPRKEIAVLGLSRGKRYQMKDVSPDLIENVRVRKVYKPAVVGLMSDIEYLPCWWGSTKKEKKDAQAFVERWNRMRQNEAAPQEESEPEGTHFCTAAWWKRLMSCVKMLIEKMG